jgi:hypothetical protein
MVGFSIIDSHACIELSELILLSTGEVINYNTLRRILGVVNTKHSPSEYSLNILARFLGFPQWRDWQMHCQNRENERFLIKNHTLTQYGFYNKDWVANLVKRMESVNWQDSYQLKSLVHAAVVNRNRDLMLSLTDLPVSTEDNLSMQRLYMSFESVIWEAMKSGPDYWSWVGEILIQRPLFRIVILEYYVNESALNGYFGYWLNLPYQETTEEFDVFRQLLNGQLEFEKGTNNPMFKVWIQGLIENVAWTRFHPIIRGRIAAWAVLFRLDESSLLEIMCDHCENWYAKAAFTTFFYRLYWTFGELTVFDSWNWRGEIPKQGMLNTFEYSQWNNYLVIQSVIARLQNDPKTCKQLLSQIDPYLFALDYFQWFEDQYAQCKSFVSEYQEHS